MEACLDIYQKFQESKIDSLEINSVAALVMGGRSSEVQRMLDSLRVKATSSFELAFNTACSLIERKKYTDAEQLLLSGRRIGQEILMEDNLPDDEIEIELSPIAVQLAYVQQLLGRKRDAIEAYADIIKRNMADESSIAVAMNNLVSLKGPKDVSDSVRKLDRLKEKEAQGFFLARGLDLKLSAKEKEAIYANRVVLLLHANKINQAQELVSRLPDMFPESVISVLLQVALLMGENKAGRAEEILAQFAADSLAKILDIQHMPATVATLVSLKERAGDIDGVTAVFDFATKWWSNVTTEGNKLNIIMQEVASFKLRHGKEEDAAQQYEELIKSQESIRGHQESE
ncbi:hypothetical protein VNO77_03405 [Canavalia gladiata]|uniref:Uncharacterized protein n=1 Tax=Canavalia gladiata TaxID=3824 RepID=A0AAN9R6T4_CANGL